MGMIGVYIMIDEKTLDEMMKLDGDGLFEKVNELEETVEKKNWRKHLIQKHLKRKNIPKYMGK